MSCNKTCDCNACEFCTYDDMVIIEKVGFGEKRRFSPCYKCMYTGAYSEELDGLKTSEVIDNFIYLTE